MTWKLFWICYITIKNVQPYSAKSVMPMIDLTQQLPNSFPAVEYPSSILDAAGPFYFQSQDILSPFPYDVQASYKSLTSVKNSCSVKPSTAALCPTIQNKGNCKSKLVCENKKNDGALEKTILITDTPCETTAQCVVISPEKFETSTIPCVPLDVEKPATNMVKLQCDNPLPVVTENYVIVEDNVNKAPVASDDVVSNVLPLDTVIPVQNVIPIETVNSEQPNIENAANVLPSDAINPAPLGADNIVTNPRALDTITPVQSAVPLETGNSESLERENQTVNVVPLDSANPEPIDSCNSIDNPTVQDAVIPVQNAEPLEPANIAPDTVNPEAKPVLQDTENAASDASNVPADAVVEPVANLVPVKNDDLEASAAPVVNKPNG